MAIIQNLRDRKYMFNKIKYPDPQTILGRELIKMFKDNYGEYSRSGELEHRYQRGKSVWDKKYDELMKDIREITPPPLPCERFGMSPVNNAFCGFFKPDTGTSIRLYKTKPKKKGSGLYNKKLLSHPAPSYLHTLISRATPNSCTKTMTFKRFPMLELPKQIDILTRIFLGIPAAMGYHFPVAGIILNDDWQVNLKTSKSQNILTRTLLEKIRNKK